MTDVIPPEWTTERLRVEDARAGEVESLRDAFNSCAGEARWDPTLEPVDTAVIADLVAKSARGPGPDPRFRMQTFRPQGSGEIAGYFHFTTGGPGPDLAWISMIVVRPEHRTRGLAREVVDGWLRQVADAGEYRAARLRVYLKNWPALRFWIGRGYTRIVEYGGDLEHGEDRHASVVLERRLP